MFLIYFFNIKTGIDRISYVAETFYFSGGIKMKVVHFYEGKENILIQLLENIPPVDQPIKIKGRRGKVIQVNEIDERFVNVFIEFDKIRKRTTTSTLYNKRRR